MGPQTLALEGVDRLRSVRAQTVQLFDLVTSEAVLRSEPMPGFRPLLWHLTHIGVYQNYWMLQRCAGQPSSNPQYDVWFDPIKTPREEAPALPTRAEIGAYLDETLARVAAFLERADLGAPVRPGGLTPAYALGLVYEHECQHQETIAFVLQTLPAALKRQGQGPLTGARASAAEEILVSKVRAQIGARGHGFAYDNELPPQTIDVEPFFIDRDLTTNAEYAQFIERGGYELRELWSDDGWAWKQQAGVTSPMGWSAQPYRERTFFSEIPLRDDAPVSGVSWYEAQAYAAFRGRRLPTEFEWEVAASWDPARGHMRRFVWGDEERTERVLRFSTRPVGTNRDATSALGLNDAYGNLWQWTSSPFAGYPGFTAYPYPEYSQLWFDGDHYVARGGSWFTHPSVTRTSFRNFYRRQFRPAFIGIRCARDAR